jgi:N4-gp56 family major capsid protein
MAGQVWLTNSLGGFMWSPQLSNVLRYAVQPLCKFRQFADVKDAAVQAKNVGDAFHWNIYSDVATAGTTLTEGTAIPQTNFVITQGTMTVTEYGNSVPYSSKLDDLSEHPVREVIQKVLKTDAKKAFDKGAYGQFALTPLKVIATAGTSTTAITVYTNGTVTGTNNVAMLSAHVKAIVDEMKERNIPPYEGDDYFAIGRPRTFRAFKDQLETLHQYTSEGFGMIANGEIGRYENTRFVEQTNIASAAWTNSKSDPVFFFGADTVAEGIVIPEEMRGMIPTDFGRNRGIAWYYLGGFGIVQTAAAQARIVQWASAA